VRHLQGLQASHWRGAPSQLRRAREIYGDDEGKVYGALVSQEAGTSLEGSGSGTSRVEDQRSTSWRKRRRQGMKNEDCGKD
jgi:hypothetical protein